VAHGLDDSGLQAAGDHELRGQPQAGDPPDQGHAVHAGHLQVAEDEVEVRFLRKDAQGFDAVGGLGHLGRAQLAHHGGELQPRHAVVVDHQHLAVLDARAVQVGAVAQEVLRLRHGRYPFGERGPPVRHRTDRRALHPA